MSCVKTDEPIEMPFMVWILGETKEPYIRWRHERGNFVGHLPADTVSREYQACGQHLDLFGRWQQRCGLSLSVLQQFVIVVAAAVAVIIVVVIVGKA